MFKCFLEDNYQKIHKIFHVDTLPIKTKIHIYIAPISISSTTQSTHGR